VREPNNEIKTPTFTCSIIGSNGYNKFSTKTEYLMKKLLLLLIVVIVFILAITLSMKNGHQVTMSYYFNYEYTGSLALLLIAAFVMGLVFGMLVMTMSLFKSKYLANKAQKKLIKMERHQAQSLDVLPNKT